MKKLITLYLLGLIGIANLNSCKKLPNGNLSDIIRYEVNPMEIQQGRPVVTTAINPGGSTKPLSLKLMKVTNAETGEDVTALFQKKYPFKVWKKAYNMVTDTTVAIIESKMVDSMVSPVMLNPYSGQLEANYHTVNIPLGKYNFDLEASNETGTKYLANIGTFKIVKSQLIDQIDAPYARGIKNDDAGKVVNLPFTASNVKVTRISSDVNKIILIIKDKNGNPFNPKKHEIIDRLNGGLLLQSYSLYGLKPISLFDDRMEVSFATLPFPLVSGGNTFNVYYQIPSQYVKYDASLNIPYNTYSVNPRYYLRVFEGGTYQVELTIPQIERVPQ